MNQQLEKLQQEQIEEMYIIPVWVSILIAFLDIINDSKKIKRAVRAVNEKRKQGRLQLKDYYKNASKKFEVNCKGYIALISAIKNARIDFYVKKLEGVNYFCPILEPEFAHQLYLSYRDLANAGAHALGGCFGLLSVSFTETNFIDLKMITDPSLK